jgi:hypothetical protein
VSKTELATADEAVEHWTQLRGWLEPLTPKPSEYYAVTRHQAELEARRKSKDQ